MIGGPLDPENIKAHMGTFTPAGARFVLDSCMLRGVQLDGDTVLFLRDLGKSDRPDWEPRTGGDIRRALYESRGITVPEKKQPVVESKEIEISEEGEEKIL